MSLRERLPAGRAPHPFERPGQAFATALFLVALVLLAYGALRFLVVDAAWTGGADACRAAAGACWPFVVERIGVVVFGFLPVPARWSVAAAAVGAVAAWLVARAVPARHRARAALALAALGVAALAAVGLPSVSSAQVGGALLTLAISSCSILLGLPLGLLLALMRVSDMPVIRTLATVWIEVWRGIPTVVALFFAITVFPLLVPRDVDISKLARALLAFTFLTSALFAEAIRGGLQSLGGGQREAAWALGLGTAQTLRLIILPQALVVATPNIVNVCVALIKETTLVLVIGLYDLFGVIQTAVLEPKWAGGSATTTGYLLAAAGYVAICGSLSHASRRFENRSRSR